MDLKSTCCQSTADLQPLEREISDRDGRRTPNVPTWVLGVLAVLGGNLLIGM